MHKKFEINQTKIKGGCQPGRIGVPHDSKSDLPLVRYAPRHRSVSVLRSKKLVTFVLAYVCTNNYEIGYTHNSRGRGIKQGRSLSSTMSGLFYVNSINIRVFWIYELYEEDNKMVPGTNLVEN